MKVSMYPGNLLAMHISKPSGFRYKSGQYIFLNIPAISPFEWYLCIIFVQIYAFGVKNNLVNCPCWKIWLENLKKNLNKNDIWLEKN